MSQTFEDHWSILTEKMRAADAERWERINAFAPHDREICGRFPSGYAMCQIIEMDGEWLKFVAPDGRKGWAKPALGTYCERDKPKSL